MQDKPLISETLSDVLLALGLDKDVINTFCELLNKTSCLSPEITTAEDPVEVLTMLRSTTQSNWLRTKGSERWDVEDTEELKSARTGFMKLFTQLNLVDAEFPSKPSAETVHQHYNHVLILGALESRVRTRVNFLQTLWKDQNVRWDKVYLLGGKRELRPAQENSAQTISKLSGKEVGECTELDMMKFVYNETCKHWDNSMQIKPVPVDAPMKEIVGADGITKKIRPNTIDTLNHYKELAGDKALKILVISNQPYVSYQNSCACSVLSSEQFDVTTVGHAASGEIKTSVILDSLARWIYVQYNDLKLKLEAGQLNTAETMVLK